MDEDKGIHTGVVSKRVLLGMRHSNRGQSVPGRYQVEPVMVSDSVTGLKELIEDFPSCLGKKGRTLLYEIGGCFQVNHDLCDGGKRSKDVLLNYPADEWITCRGLHRQQACVVTMTSEE